MSLRAASFRDLAERLRVAHLKVSVAASALDGIATTPPGVVPRVLVEGVARPVEDLVVARESAGISPALDATRRHVIQAVLNAERAFDCATSAIASYDGQAAA